MQTQHKSTPASSLARKTLGLPFAAVMALSMTGCSGDGGSPKAESLCDGAVSSVAEIALAEMTGASPLSSETGGTPERLREEALGAETEDDPWSDFTSWSCSVSPANDQDGENRIGVSVRWFPSSISFISSEAKKGSKEYLEISPSTFTGKDSYGHPEIYFPCQVAEGKKKSKLYTLNTSIDTHRFKSNGTQSDADKFVLSIARWISNEVGCVNSPEIPTSV